MPRYSQGMEPSLESSFPVKGHLDRFAGFLIAHKIELLLMALSQVSISRRPGMNEHRLVE